MIGVVDVKKFLVRRWKDLGVITGNWSGKIGFAITAAFVIVVFFAQWIAPYSPTRQFPVAYAPPRPSPTCLGRTTSARTCSAS